MNRFLIYFGLITLSIVHVLSAAQESPNTKNLPTTQVKDPQLGLTIKGNQELPNVLYIVPWKKGSRNEISPIQGRIVDEVYGPVEQHVFKRQVMLFEQFQQKDAQNSAEEQ